MQSEWNWCPHGRTRSFSPSSKSSRQMEQESALLGPLYSFNGSLRTSLAFMVLGASWTVGSAWTLCRLSCSLLTNRKVARVAEICTRQSNTPSACSAAQRRTRSAITTTHP
eukprot:scaffold2270_cov362-Prasinococcus_capsulatus_cf.AAC.7